MDDILKRNIIQELGLDRMPQAQQEEALLSVGRIIYQAVLIRVLEELNDKDQGEFEKLLTEEPGDQDAVFAFLKAKLPTLDAIVDEEIMKFKEESAGLIEKVKKG